jgi:hypothetical protein
MSTINVRNAYNPILKSLSSRAGFSVYNSNGVVASVSSS